MLKLRRMLALIAGLTVIVVGGAALAQVGTFAPDEESTPVAAEADTSSALFIGIPEDGTNDTEEKQDEEKSDETKSDDGTSDDGKSDDETKDDEDKEDEEDPRPGIRVDPPECLVAPERGDRRQGEQAAPGEDSPQPPDALAATSDERQHEEQRRR